MYTCVVDGGQCRLCGGECCHYVNSVVDALLEDGDIRPDVVIYSCLWCLYCLFVFQDPRDGVQALIRRIKNLKLVASKVGKQVVKLF